MRPQSYIGITGFTARDQVDYLLDVLPQDFAARFMVGVLVSSETLRGETNKWPHHYPKMDVLGTLFPSDPRALNLVHFNTKNPEGLVEELCAILPYTGPHCHGFQLNMCWPDPRLLEEVRTHALLRDKTIVLQCGDQAMRESGISLEVARRLKDYDGLVDYALFDPSGGYGREIDMDTAHSSLAYAMTNAPKSIGFGIAGGLHHGNLERLRPLCEEYEFSIDAQGKLRNAKDDLNLFDAELYLDRAHELFREGIGARTKPVHDGNPE